uniref:Pathogenesis related gene 5 n=1 Tax=Bupleurum kaoi TaxID=270183 RepID=E8ZB60_9APIA|nr:pathogenesis related gene 5 [Bupleurum kaoi]
MGMQSLVALAFAALLLVGGESARFTITNNCDKTIWPAALSGGGSQPSTTGFELASKATNSIDIPAPWTGRIWARTFCGATCLTGECGKGGGPCNGAGGNPPVTLVEFTLNGDGGNDFYDVSNVDGFNLPVSVAPENSGCPTTSCPGDINNGCPGNQAVRGPDGAVIACNSACTAFRRPEDCCTGEFNNPDKCKPSDSSRYFKGKCPQAYSYAYDDKSSTFTCPTGPNYKITFCP